MNASDLEKELRSLSPIAPTKRLGDRIEQELADCRTLAPLEPQRAAGTLVRSAKRLAWPGWRSLALPLVGLAAVVVLLVVTNTTGLQHQGSSSVQPPGVVSVAEGISETPDQSVAELIEAKDEGLVYGDNDELQRQVRMVFLERHTWTNPQSGAVIEFEVPREDIVMMPVAMQ